jgi:cytochrome bd-type quinol oxidase subunit 2
LSSTTPAATSTPDDLKSWAKQVGRVRVFAFFWVFALVAILNVVTEENDIFLHVVDDYTDIILAVVAIILLAVYWRKKSTQSLKTANNILTVLAVLLILATIFAITQEINDPTDFGNEIPTLFFGIFMIANRFV